MTVRIELCNCTQTLLDEIAQPEARRDDIAITYALAIISSEATDWPSVNAAIVARWSMSAVLYIKGRAWKIVRDRNNARKESAP